MSYTEILNDKLLHLPFSWKGESFVPALEKLLRSFLVKIDRLDNGPLGIESLPHITGTFVKEAQKKFVDGLIGTVDSYLDGKPAHAYEKLSVTLNNDIKDFSEILKVRTYEAGNTFFRMRMTKENVPLQPLEMFHIPFQSRGLIKTQRYSIPGFPCLYLGRTLYGCWEEMNRPDINDFQVARLRNATDIRYLDLTRPEYDDNLLSRDIYHYFMTWPLIACCSIKVNDYSNFFKPEYIIPQLLLQWVREKPSIDGIRFNSTHIDFHNTKSRGDFSNLVLPVKTPRERGHCTRLTSIFEMSQPISWQLHEHATGGGEQFLYSDDDFVRINSRIPKLELIKGRAYPYSYSVLGKLEWYLDGMETNPL